MYIVISGFLMHNNDITAGGEAFPISLTRVGKMVKASKNSYRRVYKNDGTYHYPKIKNNIMRVKGKQYFTSVDLTGSKDGTAKNPKMSLISAYKNEIIPAMDLIEKKLSAKLSAKIIFVQQEDNAGLCCVQEMKTK